MIVKLRSRKSAFTLVEIMIVVAIIGLLAALAVPGFVKARKQSQGRRIMSDTRIIDAAMEQVALEKGLKDGDSENVDDVLTYMKTTGTQPPMGMTMESGAFEWIDVLQNPYTIGNVGTNQIMISTSTKSALANVGIDWGAY